LSTRVRIWSSRCAPRGLRRICCFLTMRFLWLTGLVSGMAHTLRCGRTARPDEWSPPTVCPALLHRWPSGRPARGRCSARSDSAPSAHPRTIRDRNASDCDDFRRRAHRCGIPQSGRATRRPRAGNPWPAADGEVRAFCINSGPDTPRSVTHWNHTSSTAPRMPDGGPRAGTSSTIGPFGQADERDEVGVAVRGQACIRHGPRVITAVTWLPRW